MHLVVVVPTSAGDINSVVTQLRKNQFNGHGMTLTTGDGYNVDVVLEHVSEIDSLASR